MTTWIKSSHSGSDPYGNCVQVGAVSGVSLAELGEIDAEIAQLDRVKPRLRDLGDVAAADRRLAGLRARRAGVVA